MNEDIKKLIELVKENPELEIITMTHFEVCCSDDYNWWKGSIEKVEKDIYYANMETDLYPFYIGEKRIRNFCENEYIDFPDPLDYDKFVKEHCNEAIFIYINI